MRREYKFTSLLVTCNKSSFSLRISLSKGTQRHNRYLGTQVLHGGTSKKRDSFPRFDEGLSAWQILSNQSDIICASYSFRNGALFGILQTPGRWGSPPGHDRKYPVFIFSLTTRDPGVNFLEIFVALELRGLRFHYGDVW